MAFHAGIDVPDLRKEHPLIEVNRRAENRLFMTTLHSVGKRGRFLAVKGSPAEVLAMCSHQMVNGESIELNEETRLNIEMQNERMAGEALRVLGMALREQFQRRQNPGERGPDLARTRRNGRSHPGRRQGSDPVVSFRGYRNRHDHGRSKPHGVRRCQGSGTQPGRNPWASSIPRNSRESIPETMVALAKRVYVYSLVSPAHKLRIVQALQAAGKVVAMTGDGINDGPALKAADVGIAMGEGGTDVAREVADVVLEQDNLETLILAVSDGRTTYGNIKKSVHFFLATNFSELIVMTTALAAGIGLPLNAMQLLWINIISDIFPGLALAMEAPEPDVLDQPPRDASQPIFSKSDFKRMAFEAVSISAGELGAYGYGLLRYGMGARAASIAFQGLTAGQLLHAFSCRSEKHRLFEKKGLPQNKYLNVALGGSLLMQLLTAFVPGLRFFSGADRSGPGGRRRDR